MAYPTTDKGFVLLEGFWTVYAAVEVIAMQETLSDVKVPQLAG